MTNCIAFRHFVTHFDGMDLPDVLVLALAQHANHCMRCGEWLAATREPLTDERRARCGRSNA